MTNKIKLIGTRNIPLEEEIKEDTDYLLSLRVARTAVETLDKHGEETDTKIYKLKAINTEALQEIGGSPIKIEKGYTASAIQRFAIKDLLQRKGEEDTEENYQRVMKSILDWINSKYL